MTNNSIHLLRTSPFQDNQIQLMISCLSEKDTVVMIDDGCYLNNHPALAEVIAKTSKVVAITTHMSARALTKCEQISLISLECFNEMLFTHKNSVTWQ